MNSVVSRVDQFITQARNHPLFKIFEGNIDILRDAVAANVRIRPESYIITFEEILSRRQHYYIDIASVDNTRRRPAIDDRDALGRSSQWYNKYEIGFELDGEYFTRWFARLPEVKFRDKINLVTFNEVGYYDQINYAAVLVGRYGTPHIDEILTLRLIPQLLPQPIAEAILDCMYSVIARRFKRDCTYPYFPWSSKKSWQQEVEFTYGEMYREWYPGYIDTHCESWEDAARTAFESKQIIDDESDQEKEPFACTFFDEDDGW